MEHQNAAKCLRSSRWVVHAEVFGSILVFYLHQEGGYNPITHISHSLGPIEDTLLTSAIPLCGNEFLHFSYMHAS